MPIADDPSRPDGRVLLDPSGRAMARFVATERDGMPMAAQIEPTADAPIDAVVAQVVADLRGWIAAGEEGLGQALLAAGARGRRHAHVRSRNLRAQPFRGVPAAAPAGVTIGPLDRGAADLAGIYAAAYPPSHPDWAYTPPPADYETDLAEILAGQVTGPLLACSRLAVAADGAPAGVLIVTDLGAKPPFGGPWVAELFRRAGPELAGTGRALLEAGLSAATQAGHRTIGLAVSVGNPAERLYASLGFEQVHSSLSVTVPG